MPSKDWQSLPLLQGTLDLIVLAGEKAPFAGE
jgi:hypothetical protein